MLKKTKNISATGTSIVTVTGTETVAMTMNATINENGAVNMSKFIQNKDIYVANKSECDADYAEFEAYVDTMMEE